HSTGAAIAVAAPVLFPPLAEPHIAAPANIFAEAACNLCRGEKTNTKVIDNSQPPLSNLCEKMYLCTNRLHMI
ncbi:hypothetical protein, partial [Alistipes shahii]|uniref:hypothetical protein n=1 Tax=Alistipes shahii TaxID=328814 RepID=UPI003AAE4863